MRRRPFFTFVLLGSAWLAVSRADAAPIVTGQPSPPSSPPAPVIDPGGAGKAAPHGVPPAPDPSGSPSAPSYGPGPASGLPRYGPTRIEIRPSRSTDFLDPNPSPEVLTAGPSAFPGAAEPLAARPPAGAPDPAVNLGPTLTTPAVGIDPAVATVRYTPPTESDRPRHDADDDADVLGTASALPHPAWLAVVVVPVLLLLARWAIVRRGA
ncbi:MAG TPA: hypothetical protein VF796_19560 [Humisphaera sp.]